MPDQPILRIADLDKRFGKVQALRGLNLTLAPGEVLGFLGPNGAGKSTTLRILLGLLRADSGAAEVFGLDPWKDAVQIHRRLAYVPGDVTLWPTLTGGEAIDVLLRIGARGKDRTAAAARRDELIERFELDPSRKTGTYSKGNRQKVALVAALAADADLLLLDEPTSGLDPLMEAQFQDVVAEEKARGASILLSSHILSQVEALSDRLAIIRAGEVVQTGTLTDMRHMTRTTVQAQLERSPAGTVLERLPGVHHLRTDESGSAVFEVDGDAMSQVVPALAPLGVRSLVAHPPTLEQMLLRYYGDDA